MGRGLALKVFSGDVRFTPESGHGCCNAKCPLCANSGHWRLHRQHAALPSLVLLQQRCNSEDETCSCYY